MGTASQHCDLNTDSCSTAFMNDSYVMFSLCSTTLGFHPPPHSAPHPLISLSPRFFWHRCTFALCHPYRSSSNLKVLLCVNINTSWLELPSLWAAWVCMFLHRPTWMNILQTGKTEPTDGEGWGGRRVKVGEVVGRSVRSLWICWVRANKMKTLFMFVSVVQKRTRSTLKVWNCLRAERCFSFRLYVISAENKTYFLD